MELKNIFLVLALICITIISMPTIYSKFSGQHNINNVGDCIKCHSDVQRELESSIYHESLACEYCHGSDGGGNDSTHGNVISPRCLYCHSNIEEYLKNDSHSSFISGATYSPLRKEENEACISCHTTKSLGMKFTYSDTYKLIATRDNDSSGWQIIGSKDMGSTIQYNITYTQSSGQHYFPSLDSLKCEKCHQDMRDQLDSSRHTGLSCNDCHSNSTGIHASRTSLCTDCHFYIDGYSGGESADAHISFVFDSGKEKNMACSSCHSSFNNNIEFIRPQYIEWDVVSNVNNSNWTIENVSIGPDKSVMVNKSLDGKLHNVNIDVNCILCHKDIRDAVIRGGHSNERWMQKHSYTGEVTSEYCKSCHMPDSIGLPRHSAIKISCVDCHSTSENMGNIEGSIEKQKLFIQSYLCMSCKNTGNPIPDTNTSLHFKFYTEPEVAIYINGEQKYP